MSYLRQLFQAVLLLILFTGWVFTDGSIIFQFESKLTTTDVTNLSLNRPKVLLIHATRSPASSSHLDSSAYSHRPIRQVVRVR